MSVSQVASRYAKSLLDLAVEQGKTEIVKADMANFHEALKSRELVLLLKSPIIYPDKKLACLRSPHLYREWPIRINNKNTEIEYWFGNTKCIYTSCHDLISKILQFD